MRRVVGVLVAAILAGAAPGVGGTISLTFTAEAGFGDGELRVRLELINQGDAVARSLTPELRFGAAASPGEVVPELAPGESVEWLLRLTPAAPPGPGRWPYSIRLAYRDAQASLFQALHAGTVISGTADESEIDGSLVAAEPFSRLGKLRLRVGNTADEPRSVTVTALVPAGLAARVDPPAELEAGEERVIAVSLENRSIPFGSRVAVFVALESESGGVHQTLLVPAVVEIEPDEAPTNRRRELAALAVLFGIVWLGAVGWRLRRPGPRPEDRQGAVVRTAVDAGAVLAAVGFVASYFPAGRMLAETTAAGGDMASHFYTAAYLRDVLLPRGQLLGWCPGNLAGFPFLQFYFPLPFLVMAVLSVAVPLQIAFKLVTVVGALLLPAACYWGLRRLGSPFPGPALGALASLLFLFMEANSMWGGNLPSTLAGEFTFSFGMTLAIFFVGSLARAMRSGRGIVAHGALVALIGLAHGYALLWAGLVSLLELVSNRDWWRRLGDLVTVHGTAILLMAFWLFPLLGYSPWTTSYGEVWRIGSWQEVLPPILWPAVLLAVFGSLAVAFEQRRRPEGFPRPLGILWGAASLSLFFYLTAHSFRVVDIRFMPFLQLVVCLIAADAIARLASRLPAPGLWPLVALLAVVPFVRSQVAYIPAWIEWNYSGFEAKPAWPLYRDINRYLQGDHRDPRVAWEHSPSHERFGTTRAFESLPLFSGRSTLEGVYMQAAVTSPFIFYLQSEISRVTSCPFPQWGCGRLDMTRGVEHLEMFNVSQLIVQSDAARRAAAASAGLLREASFEDYEIYRVLGNDGRYAIPLELAPALVEASDWKRPAYRWFKRARRADPIPVFATRASADERELFAAVLAELPAELPRRSLGEPPSIREQVSFDRITIEGCEPGHPILVRVSYHPRWRALTGERVWLAGPGFLLIFPEGDRVELVFGTGPVLWAGRLASLIGLGLLVLSLLPAGRRWGRRVRAAAARLGERAPLRWALGPVRRSRDWPDRKRRGALLALVALSVAVLTVFAAANATPEAKQLYHRAQLLFDRGELEAAAAQFEAASRSAPLSMTAIHSRFFEAISYYKLERWREAESRFLELLELFPETPAAAEALWHVGLCRERMGDLTGAVSAWLRLSDEFPHTVWAEYARERLEASGSERREPAAG